MSFYFIDECVLKNFQDAQKKCITYLIYVFRIVPIAPDQIKILSNKNTTILNF